MVRIAAVLLPSITFLDLETTGAAPVSDRITEIALVRFDDGVETGRWQTLVNPEQPISSFIQQLTGIDDAMVADAPKFEAVADTLLAFLDGTVLSAHNVRFDHGFIKSEFKRIGITIRQKVLCTVKLSRLLYPAFHSHGLDAIMKRHHIISTARHRAMGDVESVLAFLDDARVDLGEVAIETAVHQLMRGPNLPPHLQTKHIEDMPETPGVYIFYGEDNLPIYIGKSQNIRARVLTHFGRTSAKDTRITQDVKHIDWIDAAGEFSALLLETKLVKEKQPVHNRRLNNPQALCSWQLNEDSHAIPLLTLVDGDAIDPAHYDAYFGTFKSKRQAREALRKIVEAYHLCAKVIGLEQGKGACFAAQLKRCKGVCCDKENPELHYLRLKQALIKHKIKPWPYDGKIAIKEQNAENGLTQLHVFSHWQYLGCAVDDDSLHALTSQQIVPQFDFLVYKLLGKTLLQKKTQVVNLNH